MQAPKSLGRVTVNPLSRLETQEAQSQAEWRQCCSCRWRESYPAEGPARPGSAPSVQTRHLHCSAQLKVGEVVGRVSPSHPGPHTPRGKQPGMECTLLLRSASLHSSLRGPLTALEAVSQPPPLLPLPKVQEN